MLQLAIRDREVGEGVHEVAQQKLRSPFSGRPPWGLVVFEQVWFRLLHRFRGVDHVLGPRKHHAFWACGHPVGTAAQRIHNDAPLLASVLLRLHDHAQAADHGVVEVLHSLIDGDLLDEPLPHEAVHLDLRVLQKRGEGVVVLPFLPVGMTGGFFLLILRVLRLGWEDLSGVHLLVDPQKGSMLARGSPGLGLSRTRLIGGSCPQGRYIPATASASEQSSPSRQRTPGARGPKP